jgi:hypothetical protein
MSPLQRFKSKLIPGAKCVFRADWCPKNTIRTVVTVQSKKVSFTHPTRAGESWLDIPKASEIVEFNLDAFVITFADGSGKLVYDFNPSSVDSATPHPRGSF